MREIFLCKYGEIALKGANRATFESLLIREIKFRLGHVGKFQVIKSQSVLRVEPAEELTSEQFDTAYALLRKTFGIVAVSRVAQTEKDFDAIARLAGEYLGEKLEGARTFKVEAKRSDKRFPLTSPQISAQVGGAVLEAMPHLKVDLYNPSIVVMTEIREEKAYIHAGSFPGAGGMPNGEYELGGQLLTLKGSECRLADGTIAGSVLKLNNAVKNVLDYTDLPVNEAFNMASLNPATAIHCADRLGSLEAGKDADIIITDTSIKVLKTIKKGKLIYAVEA